MAPATLLIFVMVLSSVWGGGSAEGLFELKCEPAEGVVAQTTHINCNIKLLTVTQSLIIHTVVLTRIGNKTYSFSFLPSEKKVMGDTRFEAGNLPSLQLRNTMMSDAGQYIYYIRSSVGSGKTTFTIKVTAKYNQPIITSIPEEIVNHGPADLYCNASGGYPAGTIHWFDHSNTNWTKGATLQSTLGNDGFFTLSSKLSFKQIDSAWEPFRCVVLNSKYTEEGGSTLTLRITDNPTLPPGEHKQVRNIVAGVVVIGSLIVGLLIALFFKRRRNQQLRRASACPILSSYPPEAYAEEEEEEEEEEEKEEEEEALNEPFCKKPDDTKAHVTV